MLISPRQTLYRKLWSIFEMFSCKILIDILKPLYNEIFIPSYGSQMFSQLFQMAATKRRKPKGCSIKMAPH